MGAVHQNHRAHRQGLEEGGESGLGHPFQGFFPTRAPRGILYFCLQASAVALASYEYFARLGSPSPTPISFAIAPTYCYLWRSMGTAVASGQMAYNKSQKIVIVEILIGRHFIPVTAGSGSLAPSDLACFVSRASSFHIGPFFAISEPPIGQFSSPLLSTRARTLLFLPAPISVGPFKRCCIQFPPSHIHEVEIQCTFCGGFPPHPTEWSDRPGALGRLPDSKSDSVPCATTLQTHLRISGRAVRGSSWLAHDGPRRND